jgi:DNA modification methylase
LNAVIHLGDCSEILKTLSDESVDLIVTSPPYAQQRKNTYGGIDPDLYVKWFLPIAKELFRVLKSDGSFMLNLKENVINGERHGYVMDLVKALQKQGWLWTETYMWHKKTSAPGKWPNRFRDAWEPIFHFTKQRQFKMFQDEVMVPIGDWAKTRIPHLSEADRQRKASATGSGITRKVANWEGKEKVYPTNVIHADRGQYLEQMIKELEGTKELLSETLEEINLDLSALYQGLMPPNPDNVLHMATECGNRHHSATFPVAIPDWFIQLFTKVGDVILDPFSGSGTTGLAAKFHDRNYIGIEIDPEQCKNSRQLFECYVQDLFDDID